MLKTSILFLLLCILVATANAQTRKRRKTDTNKTGIYLKKDTLAYTPKDLYEQDTTCKSEECSNVNLYYLVFLKDHTLNTNIMEEVLTYLNVNAKYSINIGSAFKAFADDFLGIGDITTDDSSLRKSEKSQIRPVVTSSLTIDRFREDSRIIVIESEEDISGGAHPNENWSYANWDKKEDKLIDLDNIFIHNYKDRLNTIAKKIFEKNAKKEGDSPDSYNFENGSFALNNNFQLMPKGINFFYNMYEIQPYGYGPTQLFIPYSKIKSLLLPHSVIAQYIK